MIGTRPAGFIAFLCALLFALAMLSLRFGPVDIASADMLRGMAGLGTPKVNVIMQELRLPRTLLAILAGSAFGLAGAVLQGFLRNPLAEPGTIGISGAAGLGGVIAIYHGLYAFSPFATPLCAMTGAAIATMVLYVISSRSASTLTLILAGVAMGALASALISLAMNLSDNVFIVSEMVFWLLGSVNNTTLYDIALSAPFVLVGMALLLRVGKGLDGLSLGEEAAQSLGLNLLRTRALIIAGVTLSIGAAVSVTGQIGFIGLVAPHLLRPVVGHMPSRLLLPSALAGAALLLVADIAVRLLARQGAELNLGALTALIGAPFFLYLILRERGGPAHD